MFRLRRPDDAEVREFLSRQQEFDLTYREIGFTRSNNSAPVGYAFDRAQVRLGNGRSTFDTAVAALRQWEQFNVGWAEAVPAETPLQVGEVVAVRVRTAGLWSLHACRIVYVVDEAEPTARFGFGYGTLPGHAESGEERFLIERDPVTDEVQYDVSAFFRPKHPLVRIGWFVGLHLVNRFRRDSASAMRRAVSIPSRDECDEHRTHE